MKTTLFFVAGYLFIREFIFGLEVSFSFLFLGVMSSSHENELSELNDSLFTRIVKAGERAPDLVSYLCIFFAANNLVLHKDVCKLKRHVKNLQDKQVDIAESLKKELLEVKEENKTNLENAVKRLIAVIERDISQNSNRRDR